MIRNLAALLTLFGAFFHGYLLANENTRPNIIFLFADDQRFDAIGYAGNPVIKTPNLDRLATNGTIFENAFVTTSICSISRACVISGQFARRHGVDDFFKTLDQKQLDQSYPAILRRAGYLTGFIGKWGIGHTPAKTNLGARIFDFWAGQPGQTDFWHESDCAYVAYDGTGDPEDGLCDCPPAKGQQPFMRTGKSGLKDPLQLTTEVIPMKVEQFLDQSDGKQPFCLSIFYKAPHSPFGDYAPETAKLYQDVQIPIPAAATEEAMAAAPNFIRNSLGGQSGARFVRKPETLQQHLRDYYRLVTGIDIQIGKMMRELEKRGLADNTVILFTSDNGHFKGEHGLAGKWLMYEPSQKVPAFVYDPRVSENNRGQRREELIYQIDMSATIIDLAGVGVPEEMQGSSLSPLVRGENPTWREEVFYEHPYDHKGAIPITEGIREERWKYIRTLSRKPPYEELFDLQSDPHELHNLAKDPDHQDNLERLREKWRNHAAKLK